MLSVINLVTSFFTNSISKVNSLECMSMINQKCRSRPNIIDVNTNDPVFYPYSIKVNKCSGSCNNINNPMLNYAFLILLKKLMSKYLI